MCKKILTTFFSVLFLFLIFSIPVFADPPGASQLRDLNNWGSGNSNLLNSGNKIVGAVYVIGSIASVGILMTIGIKYMMSSPEDRASIKTRAIPYLIGAIMVFAAVNIMKFVVSMAEWIQ